MYDLQSDTDELLAQFVNDYVEQELSKIERSVFEEYLSTDAELSITVRQSQKGRQALKNAYRIEAADDFEEKLARRIELEKQQQNREYSGAC